MWQQTYKAYLRHNDYDAEEIQSFVAEATDIVNSIPEPYKTRVVNLLNDASRDDFVSIDFSLLASIFKPKSPAAYQTI